MAMDVKAIYRVLFILGVITLTVKCHCDSKKYADDRIVPQIIPKAPPGELKVHFGKEHVNCGSEIHRNLTDNQPVVNYLSKGTSFHTLAMIDPDAPVPERPVFAQFVHWVVMNIPGTKVDDGKTISPYTPPSPPSYSGAHRYILLIYEQPSYIFGPNNLGTKGRSNFDVTSFVQDLDIGTTPMAGTYFYVKHDKIRKNISS